MTIRMIPHYCEGCRRVCETQPMPYSLDIFVARGGEHGSVVRRFCSLNCLAAWASRARDIRRCPDCHGTGWRWGFRSNGRCGLCRGRGSLPYPRVATSTPENARKGLRRRLASCGTTGKERDRWVEREFQLSYRPDTGETDHLEDERPGAGVPKARS